MTSTPANVAAASAIAEPARDQEARSDGHAVKERMKAQPGQYRIAGMPGDELARVRLLAKVEVSVHRMLKQMNRAVAGHDEDGAERRVRIQPQAFGHHLQQSCGHEKSRAESYEIAQVAFDALGAHQDQPASHVGQRGDCTQNER